MRVVALFGDAWGWRIAKTANPSGPLNPPPVHFLPFQGFQNLVLCRYRTEKEVAGGLGVSRIPKWVGVGIILLQMTL